MSENAVATTSSLTRSLPLQVNLEAIKPQVEAKLKQIGRRAKIAGFRPGKVPMKVLEQNYGLQAQSEALNDAVSQAYAEALVAAALRPAGPPSIEAVEAEAGAPESTLFFKAEFEVYPTITLPNPADLSVSKTVCDVSDADVQETLDNLRKQRANFEPVDRASQTGDQMRVDFKGTVDGVAFEGGTAEDFRFEVGAGQMLPEFDAAAVGMKAGESKTFNLNFPEQYHAAALAGKASEFSITVREVLGPVLPELNDAFAEAFGVKEGGLEKLRADVRANLERETRARCKAKTKGSVMDALAAAAVFDVPQALVMQEAQRMAEQMQKDFESRGMNTKGMQMPVELFKDQAQKRVHLGLLVGEVVKKQKLQATEEQIRTFLGEMAQSYESPEKFVEWAMSQRDRRAEVEAVVIEDNVVEWVLAAAKVEEKATNTRELMQENTRG